MPTPAPSASAAGKDPAAALLARPLQLPTMTPDRTCPVTRPRPLSAAEDENTTNVFGTGPVYPHPFYFAPDTTLDLADSTPGNDRLYEKKVVWVSKGGYSGPVVVRVGRVDAPGTGRVVLYYEPGASRGDAVVIDVPADYPKNWPSGTFVPGPGCYAYQIDGSTFTELVIFNVTA